MLVTEFHTKYTPHYGLFLSVSLMLACVTTTSTLETSNELILSHSYLFCPCFWLHWQVVVSVVCLANTTKQHGHDTYTPNNHIFIIHIHSSQCTFWIGYVIKEYFRGTNHQHQGIKEQVWHLNFLLKKNKQIHFHFFGQVNKYIWKFPEPAKNLNLKREIT